MKGSKKSLTRRKDGGVPGSKHHLAIDGAADFIAFLQDLPYVGKVRGGKITRKGAPVDSVCIRRSGDEEGKVNSKTKLKLVFARTIGRQDVVVVLRPINDRQVLDEEGAALLEKNCQEKYLDFKIINDVKPLLSQVVNVQLPEAEAALAGGGTGVSNEWSVVLSLYETQPPKLTEEKKIQPLLLSSARFRAYQRLLEAAVEENDQLLFRGDLSQIVGGFEMGANLIGLGLATRISKGVIRVERREIIEVLPKPRPPAKTTLEVKVLAASTLSNKTLAEEIFRDPDEAGDKIFRLLLLGSNGVRSKGELEEIVLVIDDVSARLKLVVEGYQAAALVSQAMIDSAKELDRPITPDIFGE